jgi:hypothetical protein
VERYFFLNPKLYILTKFERDRKKWWHTTLPYHITAALFFNFKCFLSLSRSISYIVRVFLCKF